ncbi:ABC transporter substrate-binding protein [Arthrobacter sp. U41]|uniref:ABC transporter substrate-binding protein n=1 Tax=Arthrobacter sp. U41 TaxID=1849032 RepID=UPI0008594B63|nr:ABC transporter substrate-binding protein [Arthrobacter sp. U41]AOT02909.1 ABC transporter substrate-binding protein [Arthrobacter sp. U41]
MSHPIDVGSVLGGRYKVTATVLTSHDQDLVLDGVDQVLNRAVSILVAGPGNADQVAQSAREVATGERPGSVQILDLGVSDATTYLITNHTSAADLLDLVVSSNPPYVEPFFTDTLGSEIFGQPRSHEPETYDGLYDEEEVDAGYINYGQNQQPAAPAPRVSPAAPPVSPARVPSRPAASPAAGAAGNGATGTGAAGAAGAAGLAAAAAGSAAATQTSSKAKSPDAASTEATPKVTAPQPVQGGAPGSGARDSTPSAPAETPKVSLWSEDDYDQPAPGGNKTSRQDHAPEVAAAAGSAATNRAPGVFPGSARSSDSTPPDDEYYGEDEEAQREPRSMRWLVGGLLAAVLVVGLVLAVTNLGSLFKTTTPPVAGGSTPTSTPAASSAAPSGTASPTAPVAGPPAIEGVTRLGSFDFAGTYDDDLIKTFDGNAASYWSDMEFATDNWGGLAAEVPLVVKLESPAEVTSVTLSQLGASGGSISVFTNDRPSLDGAKQVGSNSFTSPELTMSLQEPATAQYVIVSIKTLPKLAAPKTRYGFGLRLAEIKVQ